MSINKLKIMYNRNTRKYLRQGTDSWKRNVIKSSGYTCFITGKTQKKGNNVYLTAHHVSKSYDEILRDAHNNLQIKFHPTITEYQPGELNALLAEIERIHRDENIEGVCIEKSFHDRLHTQYGHDATMSDIREMKRNYRKMNHDNRNRVYKSKRSA